MSNANEGLASELLTAWDNLVRDVKSFFPKATGVIPYDKLPPAPKGPGDDSHVNRSLDALVPWAKASFEKLEERFLVVLAPLGYKAVRLETLRTNERQDWLYGIGRDYKAPGRTGIVTNARAATGKHPKGEAVDYAYLPLNPQMPPDPKALDAALASIANSAASDGLTWGGNWKTLPDPAHWEIKGT